MKYLPAQIGKPLTTFSPCTSRKKATTSYYRVRHNSIPVIIYDRDVRCNNFLDTIYGYQVRYNIVQVTI